MVKKVFCLGHLLLVVFLLKGCGGGAGGGKCNLNPDKTCTATTPNTTCALSTDQTSCIASGGPSGGGGLGGGLNLKNSINDVKDATQSYQDLKNTQRAASGDFMVQNIQVDPTRKIYHPVGASPKVSVSLDDVSATGPAQSGSIKLQASITWQKASLATITLAHTVFSIQCGVPQNNTPKGTLIAQNSPTSVDLTTLKAQQSSTYVSKYVVPLAPLTAPDLFKQTDLILCWIVEAK